MEQRFVIHPGRVILQLRRLRNLTQREVSVRSGLHEQTIKQLELELYWPRRKTLEKLSTLFKVEIDVFFKDDSASRLKRGKYVLP